MIRDSKLTQLLLWLSVAIVVGSYISLPIVDPDLWWHITVGRWILSHHAVPRVDYWNMFSDEKLWRAYSWSVEVLFAAIDNAWGAIGLAYAQLLLGIVLTACLQFVCGRLARDHFIGAIFGLYAAVACYNNFTLRPQVLVWIFFALAIFIADEIAEKGVSKKRLLLLALLGCAWANTHLTAALGLVAVVLWSVQNSKSDISVRRAFMGATAFFTGTLCTPYLGGEWLTFFEKGGHPLKYQVIAEFQPATILQFSTVFVLLLVFLVLVVSYTTRALPPLARGALAAGMLLAGFTAVKFIPFATIVWVMLFAAWWRISGAAHRTRVHDNFAEGLLLARANFMNLQSKTGMTIVFFMACVSVVNIQRVRAMPVNVAMVPQRAVDFMVAKNLPMPILNEFGTGGYLMYRFSDSDGNPLQKVAIDGRTNVNPDEIWQMYRASFSGRAQWSDFISKVKPGTIMWRRGSPFVSLLVLSPDWCEVFAAGSQDDDVALFVSADFFKAQRGALNSPDCSL